MPRNEPPAHYLAEQAHRLADRSGLTPFGKGPVPAVPPATDPAQRAREDLVHTLFNHNDFRLRPIVVADFPEVAMTRNRPNTSRRDSTRSIPRRTFLADVGMGFTGLALGAMLHRHGIALRWRGAASGWQPPDGQPTFPPNP